MNIVYRNDLINHYQDIGDTNQFYQCFGKSPTGNSQLFEIISHHKRKSTRKIINQNKNCEIIQFISIVHFLLFPILQHYFPIDTMWMYIHFLLEHHQF